MAVYTSLLMAVFNRSSLKKDYVVAYEAVLYVNPPAIYLRLLYHRPRSLVSAGKGRRRRDEGKVSPTQNGVLFNAKRLSPRLWSDYARITHTTRTATTIALAFLFYAYGYGDRGNVREI
jgi:hypothetical protein